MRSFNIFFLIASIQIIIGQNNSIDKLNREAVLLKDVVRSSLSHTFLNEVKNLPKAPLKTTVFLDKENGNYYSESDYNNLKNKPKEIKKYVLDDLFYYYTKFGSPLAYAAPLELLSQYRFEITTETRIMDFGFGSIGHLNLFELMGAKVTGVEVDPLLRILYQNHSESINQVYGLFPHDTKIATKVGEGYDLFISKNTLKRGFINPENDSKKAIDLKVSDHSFLTSIYHLLKPGGIMLIYNLHGSFQEDYKPWKDGRSPFSEDTCAEAGFTILAFNNDHTEFARVMGQLLGWDTSMDFEKELFATYTLLQK